MLLFNAQRKMAKILELWLSWIKNLYNIFLCKIALTTIYNKIIYNCGEMNPRKKYLEKEK